MQETNGSNEIRPSVYGCSFSNRAGIDVLPRPRGRGYRAPLTRAGCLSPVLSERCYRWVTMPFITIPPSKPEDSESSGTTLDATLSIGVQPGDEFLAEDGSLIAIGG